MFVEIRELNGRVAAALVRAGAGRDQADIVAQSIVACQRDGSFSHGLQRLEGFLSSMRSGWLNGKCAPAVTRATPSLLRVDGDNGFSQVALATARGDILQAARDQGLGIGVFHNIHHFGALWPDVEAFAREGLLALTMVSSRSQMLGWDSSRMVFGTNPIALACPSGEADPFVFDMASSVMSQGDVLLASKAGQELPDGAGVDSAGLPTRDPNAVLNGGALLPIAGAKGSALAFMVELLAAGLSGAEFGFEERSREVAAATSRSGQFLLVIDPDRASAGSFHARALTLFGALREAGVTRLPASRRYQRRRRAEREGVWLDDDQLRLLAS